MQRPLEGSSSEKSVKFPAKMLSAIFLVTGGKPSAVATVAGAAIEIVGTGGIIVRAVLGGGSCACACIRNKRGRGGNALHMLESICRGERSESDTCAVGREN